jgi:aminoglycoside phosphotransferase (APT) family kinase protein
LRQHQGPAPRAVQVREPGSLSDEERRQLPERWRYKCLNCQKTFKAWAELLSGGPATARDVEEPLVLDPGDLHADNFLLLDGGAVCLLDFENMAVRPRGQALRQLRDDTSMPQGRLGELALSAYGAATG